MIRLEDGTPVTINGVRITGIYAGMLEGMPTKDQNDGIIEAAKKEAEQGGTGWGNRKTHVVEPPRQIITPDLGAPTEGMFKEFYDKLGGPERLPKYLFQIWLTSHKTLDAFYDGSELVLIFFADDVDSTTMEEHIVTASKTFKWFDLARQFEF